MNWWEDAEARARRAKSPASLALTLQQRFVAVGLDADLAHVPAYDLASLYSLSSDLVVMVESLLMAADGDLAAVRRHAVALHRWAAGAQHWAQSSAPAFNHLMDGLGLEADALAEREQVEHAPAEDLPEEQPKVEGRYRYWHLLYERLDLKLASVGLPEQVHRGLARALARVYEECLIAIRAISAVERDPSPRYRPTARLLLDLNTTWHFDLGPFHLGAGQLRSKGSAPMGLQTWLLLAFGSN